MNKNVPFILSDTSVTCVVNGRPYTTSSANSNFNAIKEKIANEDFTYIELLFDTGNLIGKYTAGNIVVKDNAVYYKGNVVNNYVVDKILTFLREGLPHTPLCRFLDNLLENPSHRSVEQLYKYVENYRLPITDDGDFIAWKAVRSDYKDKYSGTLDNHIGNIVEMPRNQCIDDHNIACASSLHCGNWEYVKSYGNDNDRYIVVKVNPRDCVSCPIDSSWQKLRVCRYEVIGEVARDSVKEFTSEYAPISQPQIFKREIEASEDAEFEQLIEDSYAAGYIYGEDDALGDNGDDSDKAYSSDGNDYDYDSFVEGYEHGYDNNNTFVEPVAKIKPSTRAKLSKAAKKQKRNSSGRFV